MPKVIYKIVLLVLFLGLVAVLLHSKLTATETPRIDPARIYYFYGEGCTHCANVDEFLRDNNFYEKYSMEKVEIYGNRTNALLLSQLFVYLKAPSSEQGIPAIFFGLRSYLTGDSLIIKDFEKMAEEFTTEASTPIGGQIDLTLPPNKTAPQPVPQDTAKPEANIKELSNTSSEKEPTRTPKSQDDTQLELTIIPVVMGALVDSINPCEFAVLILLLTTILATGSDKKALKAGLLFSLSIFLSYLAMGLGLYKALTVGSLPQYFLKIIGSLAILLGLLNLKDFFWYGRGGFIMEVPISWRPKLKAILASVTSPAGAFAVGFLISLFLLPCTSGPYIVVLGLLSQKGIFSTALLYLILYNIIFVTPMILITLAVYKGFSIKKAEEIRGKNLRFLHLIAGLLLIGMGILVLGGWI